jgi:hypothetical protein
MPDMLPTAHTSNYIINDRNTKIESNMPAMIRIYSWIEKRWGILPQAKLSDFSRFIKIGSAYHKIIGCLIGL